MTLREFRFALTLFALVALPVLLGACTAMNPATGQSEVTFVSPADEKKIGQSQHPNVLAQFGGPYDEAAIGGYVAALGGRLAKVSELPDIGWTFTVLNSEVVNAFALPGGYVYVTRGLLALADDEAQLAGVLAHEIGHVTARHGAQRQTRAIGVSIFSAAAAILSGSSAVGQLGSQVGGLYLAGYSRDQESQADALGIRYLVRAGYPPDAMAGFLKKLGDQSALARKIAGKDEDEQFSWAQTHPLTSERVADATKLATESGVEGPRDPGRQRYLSEIDGLLYGDDPKQGLVRGREFVHPDLGFRFAVPPGYMLQNSPAAVVAGSKAGDVVLFDRERDPEVAKRYAGDMARYMRRNWLRDYSLEDFRLGPVPGLPSATGRLTGTLRNQPVVVDLVAVELRPGEIYRFQFVTASRRYRGLERAIEDSYESFRGLSAAEASAVEPLRVRLQETRAGRTLADYAALLPFDDFKIERLAVLNGLAPGTGALPPVIKTIQAGP
ncbi:M48 family metalloprotease [Oceanibacterium hippocampi]|uniref:TPR repeat-containing protein YfgC n=1 Tax=Oceanibacterium hippocampi TaxID=745714 RepID=A0A1Y5R6G5_9PROT|nr:M48 family metalloprotease [Oceanibacterium hippocampi]SLN10288.1 TPR repeat-containing protein YfgC precursor [Oceanibacterium hippocampi]